MSHYETQDEDDVARGIVDALVMEHRGMTGADWLGWDIIDLDGLAEIEISTPEGKRYRVTVEPIEDDAP